MKSVTFMDVTVQLFWCMMEKIVENAHKNKYKETI